MINTIKSILRFFKSVVGEYSPIKSKVNSVESVVNYMKYNDSFSSSGQPTKHQFSLIQQERYAVVINLAPYDLIEYPLKDEEAIVTTLGMKYPRPTPKPIARKIQSVRKRSNTESSLVTEAGLFMLDIF